MKSSEKLKFVSDRRITRLEQIKEFHKAYGFRVAPEPDIPAWTSSEKAVINTYAEHIAIIAEVLKQQAAFYNGLGKKNLGLVLIRLQLIVEETAEVAEAVMEEDLPHLLQELSDLDYVVGGTFLTFGLQGVKAAAEDELHAANMSKLVDGRPIVDKSGRSVKGPGYRKPDMLRVLAERPGAEQT